jgi:hypothetical protein
MMMDKIIWSNEKEVTIMTHAEKAYQTVCKILNVKPAKITESIPDRADATTVIVPNKLCDYEQLVGLAEKFGEDQPYPTYAYKDLYKQYSAEELSGKRTDGPYRIVYIPKQYTISAAPISQQLKQLEGHIPTVLEAICFWFTLREAGEPLDFDNTYIRHIDLPIKTISGDRRVADSCVYGDGRPYLDNSLVGVDGGVRVAVGSDLEFAADVSAMPFSLDIPEIVVNGKTYVLKDE